MLEHPSGMCDHEMSRTSSCAMKIAEGQEGALHQQQCCTLSLQAIAQHEIQPATRAAGQVCQEEGQGGRRSCGTDENGEAKRAAWVGLGRNVLLFDASNHRI